MQASRVCCVNIEAKKRKELERRLQIFQVTMSTGMLNLEWFYKTCRKQENEHAGVLETK